LNFYLKQEIPNDIERKSAKRTIRGIECRLLGWFELEPELVPLDKNLKPIKNTESE
jgi:hypothetical protein